MCGIACYLGFDTGIEKILCCLTMLLKRGYDSAGMASINRESKLVIDKFATTSTHLAIDKLKEPQVLEKHIPGQAVISHTRWLTSSVSNVQNAHPFADNSKRFAIVHNGVIENALKLREMLESKYAVVFASDTDSEVIAHLLSVTARADPTHSVMQWIKKVSVLLVGSWALGVLDSFYPYQLHLCKEGSPLVVGWNANRTDIIACSEPSALAMYYTHFIALGDGDTLTFVFDPVTKTVEIPIIQGETYIPRQICVDEENHQDYQRTAPVPYAHWTLKEIMDQPHVLSALLVHYFEDLNGIPQYASGLCDSVLKLVLTQTCHVVFLGVGSSFNAACVGVSLFKAARKFTTVQAVDAADFDLHRLPFLSNSSGQSICVIALSPTGEHEETISSVKEISQHYAECITIGIVNVSASRLAALVKHTLYIRSGREVAFSNTKTFTAQVFLLKLLCGVVTGSTACILFRELRYIPRHMQFVLQELRTGCRALASKVYSRMTVSNTNTVLLLAQDDLVPYAMESALKLKEISGIHAESFAACTLKHGPVSILRKGTPCIIFCPYDPATGFERMMYAAEEAKARGAFNILISGSSVKPKLQSFRNHYDVFVSLDEHLPSDTLDSFSLLYPILPIQMLAYFLALSNDTNPDFPFQRRS